MENLSNTSRSGLGRNGLRLWGLLFLLAGMVGRSIFQMKLLGIGQISGGDLLTLMQERGVSLAPSRYMDCGLEIFTPEQDVHAGGSGCGCSAVTLCGHIFRRFEQGELKRVLFMATGALLSPTTSQQGDTIPGIAHAIALEADA